MLASVTFTNETASGWQQALFSNPVAVTAGVTYVASYYSPSGYFGATGTYFTEAKENGPLRGLANNEDGPNGLYRYSETPVFPNNGYNSSNYWVDVLFTPGTTTDNTAPAVTSVTPANGSTGININPAISATFSESLSAASVTTSTVQLKTGATTLAANVSFSSSVITLDPVSPLSNSTTYTVVLKGGTSGIKDLAGNALVNDYSWSFTTNAGSSSTLYTIFQTSDRPAEPLANDGQGGIVLGTRFRSSQNGFITGIRYYKGNGTTGNHTGTLWSNSGSQLASVTFTGETASGWQQASFSNPVSIAAGVTYVASIFSSSGDYCATDPYFSQAKVNGPLRALANGEDGPNGLYRYTSSNVFPDFSFNASNYWVDVVFAPADLVTNSSTSDAPPIMISSQNSVKGVKEELQVNVLPNPSNSFFTVVIAGADRSLVNLRVFDINGQVVEKHEKISVNQTMRMGAGWRSGSYFIEVIQNGQRKYVKIIKAN
jgi:hypothetical protein